MYNGAFTKYQTLSAARSTFSRYMQHGVHTGEALHSREISEYTLREVIRYIVSLES